MVKRSIYIQMMIHYAPAWGFGGPVRIMSDYARWMKKRFKVLVFAGDIHHDYSRIKKVEEDLDGISIKRYKIFYRKWLARKNVYLVSPLIFIRIATAIRYAEKPVILHICELRGSISIYAAVLKLVFKEKVILTHSAFGMLHFKKSIIRKIYDLFFLKILLTSIDIGLAQNQHEMEAYYQLFSEYKVKGDSKITFFPLHLDRNSDSTDRYISYRKAIHSIREVREKYSFPVDALIFIFLGRLHPSKGIIRVIDTFLHFCSQCDKKSLLLIVGRDDGFQEMIERHISKRSAEERIWIINNVYEKRFDYYYLADLFLGFPEIYEETMLSSIEAMSCGTPIVVSKEADSPYVEEGEAGHIIDYDMKSAVTAINDIIDRLELFQENSLRLVETKFSAHGSQRKLLQLFDKKVEFRIKPQRRHFV